MIRSTRLMLLLVAAPIALGACRKKQPATVPPTPTQQPTSTPTPPPPTNTAPPRDTMAEYNAAVAATRAMLTNTIYFEYDSDELTAESRAKLEDKLRVMNANPQVRIRINGHCDERGTDEYNLVLGRRRAEQAKRFLTDRGIDPSRIETMSFGRERPVAMGSSEEAWAQNRRDEIEIISGGESLRPVR